MRNALLALPLLAACALHAQDATVVGLTAPSKCLTVTVDVTIPEQAVGTVLSLKTQKQVFNLMIREAGGQASCYYYDNNGTLTQTDDSTGFDLPAGRHTLTLAYHADNSAATKGTRVWLDGALVFNADKLRWANNDTGVTSITVGNDAKDGTTQMAGLTLHQGSPTIDEDTVPAPRLSANAGSFTIPGANLDNSVTIAAAPITLNGVSANTFSVTLDAELPEGTNGTLIGWQVKKNNNTLYTGQAERNTDGEPLRHSGTTTITTDPKQSPSDGRHIWTLTYDGSSDGARLYEDGTLIAHAEGLKWRNTTTNVGFPAIQITIGDSVSEQPGPFAGMKVYAVRVKMGSTAIPENAMTALYDVPEELSRLGEAALRHLMTQNGRVGDFTVPAVTLNGETLGAADAARALWLFGKTGPFTEEKPLALTWGIADLSVAGDTITLIPDGDTPQNGVLSVLEKAALNETWQRVEATQADTGAFTVSLGDGATAFYTIRAEEEEQALGPVVTLDPTPAAGVGMPSQVLPPTDGTSAAKAVLFNFNLDGAFDDLGEAQRSSLTLTLEGDGLMPGATYTLTVDGTSHTATLEAPAAAQRRLARANGYALPHTVGTLVFTGFTLTETSTVSLSGPAVAGQITVTESSWGLAGQTARVAATLADDLVKDGFVPENNSLEMMSYRRRRHLDAAPRRHRRPELP